MSSATAGSRAHTIVDALALITAPIVVPHDPAPTTATDVTDAAEFTLGSIRGTHHDDPMTQTNESHRSGPSPGTPGPGTRRSGAPAAGVAIPIRAFALGKVRLAEHLSTEARGELGRRWADQVVGAAGALPTVVISSDPEVVVWAAERALSVIDDPGSLDTAAEAGRAWVAARGLARVVIAHADLPDARTFAGVVRDGALPIVTIVPCHRDDGTPVVSVPVDLEFRFAYGPGSFRRHAAEARRIGAAVRIVRDPSLAFDVDVPSDLALLRAASPR